MEKVKIKTCIDTGKKTKKDTPIIEILLEDGRKGSGFDSAFMGIKPSDEIEIEIKQAPDYNNEKRFYFMIPGKQNPGSKFPQKDWTFEKKKASLELAVNWCNGKEINTSDMLKCAHVFFDYLNKKES
jgi:hypothetical protein